MKVCTIHVLLPDISVCSRWNSISCRRRSFHQNIRSVETINNCTRYNCYIIIYERAANNSPARLLLISYPADTSLNVEIYSGMVLSQELLIFYLNKENVDFLLANV